MKIHLALLLVVAALVSQAAQQPEGPRHDKYATDKDAYCFNPATSGSQAQRRQRDAHAHSCECRLICQLDQNGDVVGDQETSTCELYCTRTHCLCHQGEEPCEKPSGSGLVDMDDRLVAVSRAAPDR